MSETQSRAPASGYRLSGAGRRNSPAQHRSARNLLIIWSIGLTLLSLLPLHVKRTIGTTGKLHDMGHILAFAITSVLFLRYNRPGPWAVWRLWPVLLFAIGLEAVESVLYGNILEWPDIGLDALGMLAGLLAYWFSRTSLIRSRH